MTRNTDNDFIDFLGFAFRTCVFILLLYGAGFIGGVAIYSVLYALYMTVFHPYPPAIRYYSKTKYRQRR